jgi:hypothetical protein
MASSASLAQIEQATRQLSYDERLWLICRLADGLRNCSRNARPTFDAELAQMAADPEMQHELAQIEQEFGPAEMDGLE